jgi:hypothetical protein
MGLLEFALIFAVVFTLYNLQQIKITLKEKGLAVDVIKGSLGDYRKFKDLIRNESDQSLKIKYQKILNGLYFSLFGIVLFVIMIVRHRL